MHHYENELILFIFQLMTSQCYEKDLCQIALMRSKIVIQFHPATTCRIFIMKLRFTAANSGIMGQLCKIAHLEMSKKKGSFPQTPVKSHLESLSK